VEDIKFTLNDATVSLTTDRSRSLLWVLRGDLELTGTKYGCGEGLCGACTVLVDRVAERACLLSVGDVEGKVVTTIEGLGVSDRLHPLQEAFMRNDALQCGYCTPGMILTAAGLLESNPDPTDDQIIAAMDGNFCRCGAHVRILQAIREAAEDTKS
jgi:aerobic-type carbon monoxide dehydrogenase small subunit (CoxS/CutS family)